MRCKLCKDKFIPKYFLQKYCMRKNECIKAFSEYVQKKQEKNTPKSKRKARPDIYMKENKKDLQDAVQLIARLIDKGAHCIDCERTEGKPCWDGGHYKSKGAHPAISYNLHNIFKQTRYCNHQGQTSKEKFLKGIEKMYGKEYAQKVSDLSNIYLSSGVSHTNIIERVSEARKIIRELKNKNINYAPEQRIRLREHYNQRIGIYLI